MKLSLLDMVKEILNDMDSLDVDDINTNDESRQVASILRSRFRSLVLRSDFPFMKEVTQLEGLGLVDQPTKLKIPDQYKRIDCVKYDTTPDGQDRKIYTELTYLDPCSFIDRVQGRDNTADNVEVYTTENGIELFIRTDIAPNWWTSFDNTFIYFDSIDKEVDSTIQQTKTVVEAVIEPGWVQSNEGGPTNFPDFMYQVLVEDAKSAAFEFLKQVTSRTASRTADYLYAEVQQKNDRTRGDIERVDYSRKGKRGWKSGTQTRVRRIRSGS